MNENQIATMIVDSAVELHRERSLWERVTPAHKKLTAGIPGATDRYLSRNAFNSNCGVIMFTNGSVGPVRFVSVELDDNRVRCQTSIGK